jgi:anti-sigma factor ChrR (cupin superfamily)
MSAEQSGGEPHAELTNTEVSMRTRHVLTLLMTLTLSVAVLAQGSGQTTAQTAPKPAASQLVVIPASDMKWTDLGPGAPGVKVADLWGNHVNGAFGALFKLPAGFAAPLHTHTYDMKVVIMSGTYIQAPEGKPEFRLGPGSYFFQPGGNYRHTTTCDNASDCVFLVESKGPFDLKPVDAGKGPTK